jgi:hypothetical protein
MIKGRPKNKCNRYSECHNTEKIRMMMITRMKKHHKTKVMADNVVIMKILGR